MSLRSSLFLGLLAFATVATACSDTSSPTTISDLRPSFSGGSGGAGGGGGGGGGSTAGCVAQISSFSNTGGYGPYGPNVADIRTKLTVKNCTGAPVAWTARATYTGPFWGGSTFAFPLSCDLTIGANSSGTCQITERYLFIQQIYGVQLDIIDASGNILATQSASVATPLVPNPNAT